MNISATSSLLSPLATTAGVQPTSVGSTSDPNGDGDGNGGRVHHSHRGGQMRQALMQALQSLGLSMPQATTGASASTQTSASAEGDGDADGSTAATGNVKQDMRQFMHALFLAVNSEAAPAASTGSSVSGTQSNFASGLSALISQVSSGTAPASLQSAFAQLTSDLQQAANSSVDPTAGATSAGTAQATLQALLSALQQDLGYGASSTTPAVGNSISTQA